MYPGQISNPVKTQFGWHIIKMEDKRKKEPPPFEAVKPQIEAFLVRKAQNDLVAQLRKDAKVERLEKPAEKPAEAAPSSPAQQPPAPPPASQATPPAPPASPAEQPKQ
jgi:peptidyl-prolyl cis-trans isomerase C